MLRIETGNEKNYVVELPRTRLIVIMVHLVWYVDQFLASRLNLLLGEAEGVRYGWRVVVIGEIDDDKLD